MSLAVTQQAPPNPQGQATVHTSKWDGEIFCMLSSQWNVNTCVCCLLSGPSFTPSLNLPFPLPGTMVCISCWLWTWCCWLCTSAKIKKLPPIYSVLCSVAWNMVIAFVLWYFAQFHTTPVPKMMLFVLLYINRSLNVLSRRNLHHCWDLKEELMAGWPLLVKKKLQPMIANLLNHLKVLSKQNVQYAAWYLVIHIKLNVVAPTSVTLASS